MTARTHPFFDFDTPLALAHQGGGAEETENSAAAFADTHRLGYRQLDIDLQVTSDQATDPVVAAVRSRSLDERVCLSTFPTWSPRDRLDHR